MSDDWMDAFGPDDLADPELARVDAAVDRLAGRIPRRRTGRWVVAGLVGLAAAAALAIALNQPTPPDPIPTPPAPTVVVAPPAPTPPPPIPAPAAPRLPPRAEPAAPVLLPGLVPAREAVLVVRDGRAELERGGVTYLHDPTHDPGVGVVGISSVAVDLVPTGTVFSVEARDGLGAFRVDAGRVRAVHRGGRVLAELGPGQEALMVQDPTAPDGVGVIQTTGLPLDAVEELLPLGCRPQDAVSAIASLRLPHHPEVP